MHHAVESCAATGEGLPQVLLYTHKLVVKGGARGGGVSYISYILIHIFTLSSCDLILIDAGVPSLRDLCY